MTSIDDTSTILTDRGELSLYHYFQNIDSSVYFYDIVSGLCKRYQTPSLRAMGNNDHFSRFFVKTERSPEGVWVSNMIATQIYWALPMVGMDAIRIDPQTKKVYTDRVTDVYAEPIPLQDKARYRLLDNFTIGAVINGFPTRPQSDVGMVLNRT